MVEHNIDLNTKPDLNSIVSTERTASFKDWLNI